MAFYDDVSQKAHIQCYKPLKFYFNIQTCKIEVKKIIRRVAFMKLQKDKQCYEFLFMEERK